MQNAVVNGLVQSHTAHCSCRRWYTVSGSTPNSACDRLDALGWRYENGTWSCPTCAETKAEAEYMGGAR